MYAVRHAPEMTIFATAHVDGMVPVWRGEPPTLQSSFSVRGRFIHGAIAFSPDGLWLATGSMDGSVNLWDPITGKSVRDVGRHRELHLHVGLWWRYASIVSGGSDGLCYVWDLRPTGAAAKSDLTRLWLDLTGEDSQAAYAAMIALLEIPDRATAMLVENLPPR